MDVRERGLDSIISNNSFLRSLNIRGSREDVTMTFDNKHDPGDRE